MGRIRTVKPELFRHTGLFGLEQKTGLPIRTAFVGLFTACDREGRFRWKPIELKLDVLPYDAVDFEEVLDALHRAGFIVKYELGGKTFGCIPTWKDHQVVNNRECASRFPAPGDAGCKIVEAPVVSEIDASSTRAPRVPHACPTRETGEQGEFALTGVPADTPPATPARKKANAPTSDAEKDLYRMIKESFEGTSGAFADYKREGAAIKRIIAFAARDAPNDQIEYVRRMVVVFRRLTASNDRWWSSQPFIPSQLASGGIWPRVKLEVEKEVSKTDGLDAETVGDAMAALGASKR